MIPKIIPLSRRAIVTAAVTLFIAVALTIQSGCQKEDSNKDELLLLLGLAALQSQSSGFFITIPLGMATR